MITQTLVYVGLAIVGVIVVVAVACFAVVMLFAGVFDPDDEDERADAEAYGDMPVSASWPKDNLSREFEQEPRGM